MSSQIGRNANPQLASLADSQRRRMGSGRLVDRDAFLLFRRANTAPDSDAFPRRHAVAGIWEDSMKPKRRAEGPGTIELIEEAVHLLRRAPAGLLALNALRTLPFALAFLYFWAEMSRGAFARENAGRNAIGVALAFLWMKFWQAVFSSELRARVAGQAIGAVDRTKRCGQLALTQTALQPIGLFRAFRLPRLSYSPFGWAYCFFQNVTTLPEGSSSDSDAWKSASQQASLRQEQNFLVLSILLALRFFCRFGSM